MGPWATPAIPVKVVDEAGGTGGIAGVLSVEQALHFRGGAAESRFPWHRGSPGDPSGSQARQSCALQLWEINGTRKHQELLRKP